MKIIKSAPAVPEPPRPPKRHSCEDELRQAERDTDLYRRWGTKVQCSCGCMYELRPTSALRYLTGAGFNNVESRYFVIQYWRYLGWSDPR